LPFLVGKGETFIKMDSYLSTKLNLTKAMNDNPPTERHDLDLHDVKEKIRPGFSKAEWDIAYPLLVKAVAAMIDAGTPAIGITIEVSPGRNVYFAIDRQA